MPLPHYSSLSGIRRGGAPTKKISNLALVVVAAIPSFLLGTLWANVISQTVLSPFSPSAASGGIEQRMRDLQMQKEKDVERLVALKTSGGNLERLCADHAGRALENHLEHDQAAKEATSLFNADAVGRFAVAMSAVSKQEFTDTYDLGVPLDSPKSGSEDILLLYSSNRALPTDFREEDHSQIQHLELPNALENCEYLNVVLTDHSGSRKQCLAIVPQYESYHLQKWMRVDPKGKLNVNSPLQLVSRGRTSDGMENFQPPDLESETRKHWIVLERYFANLNAVLEEIKPILMQIAIQNTVVVMVCNFGQSELLMNFVCAARSRGLNLSNVIVFTTDEDTTELAKSLGISTYYDHRVCRYHGACLAYRNSMLRFTN